MVEVSPEKKDVKKKTTLRKCGTCERLFASRSRYSRFCEDCKTENENYRFAEWIPHGVQLMMNENQLDY